MIPTSADRSVRELRSGSELTPPGDLYCWLWAAWPPTDAGRLDIARIAGDIEVSPSTIRRWLAEDRLPVGDLRTYLARRAILRGRGAYIWPPPDLGTVERDRQAAAYALDAARRLRVSLRGSGAVKQWRQADWHRPHFLQILRWPNAHVETVHVVGPRAHLTTLTDTDADDVALALEVKGARSHGAELVSMSRHTNRHTATTAMHRLLDDEANRRCIAPAALVPTGRTHALLD